MTGQINYLAAQARYVHTTVPVLINPAHQKPAARRARGGVGALRLFHRRRPAVAV
jgi:hypothetical protein